MWDWLGDSSVVRCARQVIGGMLCAACYTDHGLGNGRNPGQVLDTTRTRSCVDSQAHRNTAHLAEEIIMTIPTPHEFPVHLIFGASGGIGSEVARRLAASGATVALASKSSDRLDELARQLGAPKWDLDMNEPTRVELVVTDVVERFGRLDGVANCIGSLLLKAAHLTSFEEWNAVIAANLTSAFAVVRSAAKAMRQHGGSIVLVVGGLGRLRCGSGRGG